ncbi:MAG TPA: hypothetical protein DC054_21850 [Blastocatellia bacterium]|nr:hypothetical protein [Blastocatellia bacterium]
MNQEQVVVEFWKATPPPIGKCQKCQTEILASHAYSWCTACKEPLPYGINMERRPIMYGTIKVTPASFVDQSMKSSTH